MAQHAPAAPLLLAGLQNDVFIDGNPSGGDPAQPQFSPLDRFLL
jgi:hypothetical protein